MASKTVPQNRKAATNGHIPKKPPVTAELVSITPDLAATWLKLNEKNRNMRSPYVATLAREMTAGNWQLTGEAIKFSNDGKLIDGQHRLAAIVLANVAVTMLVVRGVAAEAMTVLDSGAKRTSSDALHLRGYKNAAIMAAAARLAINWEAGNLRHAHQSMGSTALVVPTHTEILDWLDDNPDLATFASMTAGSWKRITAGTSVICFTSWACGRIDADLAVDFYSDLAEFRTTGSGDPRHALLNRLNNARKAGVKLTQSEQADAFFRAWNAVREGRTLTKVYAQRGTDNFTDPR